MNRQDEKIESKKSLFYCAKQWCILKTSIKTALLVGTALALINHYQNIFAFNLNSTEIIQIMVTYLVPFSVATFAAAKHAQRTDVSTCLDPK